jgi:hypothetical protein
MSFTDTCVSIHRYLIQLVPVTLQYHTLLAVVAVEEHAPFLGQWKSEHGDDEVVWCRCRGLPEPFGAITYQRTQRGAPARAGHININ